MGGGWEVATRGLERRAPNCHEHIRMITERTEQAKYGCKRNVYRNAEVPTLLKIDSIGGGPNAFS